MSDQQSEVTVAIVYADISGSTALYDRVGNIRARAQIENCLSMLRTIISEFGGEFIHSRGDDVLCTFDAPQNAFLCAKTMLERTAGNDLLIHAGLDFGPAIRTHDDVFGDCVNVAARLASLANPKEALCSKAFQDRISPDQQSEVLFFDSRRLRGKAAAENIYRYADIASDAGTQISFGDTDLSAIGRKSKNGDKTAQISFLRTSVICGANAQITIGRADDCDLVVPRQWVSRQHAVIEMRKDHAYLRDISTNGTYVCLVGQQPVLLRRETMALPSICTLSPTKHPSTNDAVSITCHVAAKPPSAGQ